MTQCNDRARNRLPTLPRFVDGFTIIELMVVAAIVAIIAAVALPSYNEYVIRGKIPDATAALANKRARMELFYDNNRTYVDAPDCATDTTTSKYFSFACSVGPTASAYTLKATGVNSMASFGYTIDQANAKETTSLPEGWTGVGSACWVLRKDGSC